MHSTDGIGYQKRLFSACQNTIADGVSDNDTTDSINRKDEIDFNYNVYGEIVMYLNFGQG